MPSPVTAPGRAAPALPTVQTCGHVGKPEVTAARPAPDTAPGSPGDRSPISRIVISSHVQREAFERPFECPRRQVVELVTRRAGPRRVEVDLAERLEPVEPRHHRRLGEIHPAGDASFPAAQPARHWPAAGRAARRRAATLGACLSHSNTFASPSWGAPDWSCEAPGFTL